MFNNLGWSEIVVIVVAGLVILGPERLPGVINSLMQTFKKLKNMAEDASGQLKEEFGPDFEAFQEPINQINELRSFNPKKMISQQFLDDQPTIQSSTHSANSVTSEDSSKDDWESGYLASDSDIT